MPDTLQSVVSRKLDERISIASYTNDRQFVDILTDILTNFGLSSVELGKGLRVKETAVAEWLTGQNLPRSGPRREIYRRMRAYNKKLYKDRTKLE